MVNYMISDYYRTMSEMLSTGDKITTCSNKYGIFSNVF